MATKKALKKTENGPIDFEITGGHKLHGSIKTNTSKNGALGLICASLLNKSETLLHGIPHIEEIYRIIEILESIGVKVKWVNKDTLSIQPPKKFELHKLDVAAASRFSFGGLPRQVEARHRRHVGEHLANGVAARNHRRAWRQHLRIVRIKRDSIVEIARGAGLREVGIGGT